MSQNHEVDLSIRAERITTNTYDGLHFRVPNDLTITDTPIRRIILIGQCLLDTWQHEIAKIRDDIEVERVLFNRSTELPFEPPHAIDTYDFQVVAIPLRSVLHEYHFMRLPSDDAKAFDKLFDDASARLALLLSNAMRWNTDHGLLSFVANFFVPQQNPNGRLLARYDLRNLAFFIEQLNRVLAEETAKYRNAYSLDLEGISASIGKRWIQDDMVHTIAHGSLLTDFGFKQDQSRIEPPSRGVTRAYASKSVIFVEEMWRELEAMYRTLKQIDMVKMVIVDLDDTLWRGVLAEADEINPTLALDGWPIGVVEALSYLRRRGVILAIVSKNEESNVKRIFERLLSRLLPLGSFSIRKINWQPKAQNVGEVIREANLLPRNVVFVDDNPVERAAVLAAFPELRVIGADPYILKRVLLWSAETQVAAVTTEAVNRGEMIKAQVLREAERSTLTRAEFLQSLCVRVSVDVVSLDHPRFQRAFELLNKTNQFNTTGKRWTQTELTRALAGGMIITVFHVEDKFTDYGLVGIILHQGMRIIQFVMSCRVLGLDVEKAALIATAERLRAGSRADLRADFVETDANFPCRQLYSSCGFELVEDEWRLFATSMLPPNPPHIELRTVDPGMITRPALRPAAAADRTTMQPSESRSLPAVPAVIYDDDELRVIYQEGQTEYLLVTFNELHRLADGTYFWGNAIAEKEKISTVGFVTKKRSWFPRQSVLAAVKALAEVLSNFNERILYGYSMGGYGALKYSAELGATTVIAFAPQFSINPGVVPFESRYTKFFNLNGDQEMQITSISGNAFIFYDPWDQEDRQHVSAIDRVANVSHIPVPRTGHDCFHPFASHKAAQSLLTLCRERDVKGLALFVRGRRQHSDARKLALISSCAVRHPKWSNALFNRMIASSPAKSNADLAARLCHLHYRAGQFSSSLYYADFIAKIDPDGSQGQFLRSGVLRRLGRIKEALEAISEAIARKSDDFNLWVRSSELLMLDGQTSPSIAAARRAVDLSPGKREAHLNLINTLMSLHRWMDAFEASCVALEHHRDDLEIIEKHRSAREHMDALESIRRSAEQSSSFVKAEALVKTGFLRRIFRSS